jgi:hypothetical protein
MRLEVGTFPVREVGFGARTRYRDGTLELSHEEMLDLVRNDPRVERARIELARPGDSARIINHQDVVEPRVKVEGGGVVYPGVSGRSTDLVGRGRTHRFGGLAVVECLDTTGVGDRSMAESRLWRRSVPGKGNVHFVDMSGPGAVTPYAALNNLCVVVGAPDYMSPEEQLGVAHAAGLRLADHLAGLIAEPTPPEVETFDLAPASDLPRIVYIPHLASDEPAIGARGSYGIAVYGQIRLSAPWLLDGTELLDGAVSGGGASWVLANNPVVLDLCRRHGRELNFVGVIVQRTNWTNQNEYRMAADRACQLALKLGAQGAIVTTDIRGQRWVGTMLTLSACEQAGIKTVLLTEEEDNEDGATPPVLFAPAELVAAVSNGTGDVPQPFPPVERVIGTIDEAPPAWFQELPPIHGRYGTAHVRDYEGFGRRSYADF